jgi:hypothetical protein
MRAPAILVSALLAAGLMGCGSPERMRQATGQAARAAQNVKFVNGGFEFRDTSFLKIQRVLDIKVGTPASVVHSRFGRPFNQNRPFERSSTPPHARWRIGLTCWWYLWRNNLPNDLGFCMDRQNQVRFITVSAN